MKKILFILCLTVISAFIAQSSYAKEVKQVTLWGGYNFASSDIVDSMDASAASLGSSSTTTTGGIAAGVDFWMGETFQYGGGIGYLKFYSLDFTVASFSVEANLGFVPVMVQARYFLLSGLHVGGGIGYFFGVGTYEFNGVETDAGGGSCFAFEALVGYDLAITESVVINLGCRAYIGFDSEFLINIVPSGGVGFKF
ncbi:MAG: hypothetical protein GY754_29810 [bacterium]|nr:hypothetical protein [bacterium]